MSEIVYFNGEYLPKSEVRISPDDRGFLFADGIYEVVRMYDGIAFGMQDHVDRLASGMSAIGIRGVDASVMADVCDELIGRNDLQGRDAVVYIQITRGEAPRTHHFPDPPVPPTVYANAWAFIQTTDPTVGVKVVTAPDHRWTRCDIKSVSLLPNCMAAQQAAEAGAYEAVLVRAGMVIEGTRSSLLGVVRGEVRTAPESNYILPSITRAVALDLCRAEGIPVAERPMTLDEFGAADELFLAGTTSEIMPIVEVDGSPVSNGQPGPIATRLALAFSDRVAALSR
jgi:D-alanine transaminase